MSLTRGDADAALLALRFRRWIARDGARLADPDFWHELNPELAITDRPIAEGTTPYDAPWAGTPRLLDRLKREGCCVTPPIVPDADLAPLRAAITRLVDAGFPAFFLLAYDEVYRVYGRLRSVVAPVLGSDPFMVPDGSWVFWVPAGADTQPRWTTFGPHRDAYYPDPGVLAGELPTMLLAWVALTDVTPEGSCVYVVPADCDPDYRTELRTVHPAHVRWQDIRAMPAPAGAVLLMSGHLAHWGSRGSARAAEPRMSMTFVLQRRDVPPCDPLLVGFDEPMPFRARLKVLYDNLTQILPADQTRPLEKVLLG